MPPSRAGTNLAPLKKAFRKTPPARRVSWGRQRSVGDASDVEEPGSLGA